jgi:hypothetical protein
MEDDALENRISLETQQQRVQTLQEEQSKFNLRDRQLQVAIQEKDGIIQ